jgi:subtilisin family serine protease
MRQTRIVVRQAVALGGVLALAACSGGGGSSNSSQVSTASVADFETPEFESSPALGQINAAEGYASITGRQGGEGVRIAVLDDGVEADHLDLDDNIVADISFNDLVEVPFVDGLEDGVHGTAVAGVIAAEKNDSGMHGVAFEAGLVSIDISVADQDALDAGAEPNTEIFLSIAEGIRISAGLRDPANGEADIINMSLGLDVENITGNDALSDAVVDTGVAMGEAADQGKIIVVAAGNGSAGQVSFPGGFVDVADIQGLGIVVSSVDADDNLSAFSNQCGSDAAFCLVAPGEQIRTTLGDNTFGNLSGTSFSTPFVSGSAAVVKAAFPGISNRDVVARLLSTAEDLGAPGTDAVFGRGRLDLDAALAPVGSLGLSLDGAVDGDRAIATESRLDLGAGVTLDGEGSALLAKAVAFDEQGFPFGVDLSRQADDRSRSTGLAAFVGSGRQDIAVQNSAFGSLSLAFAEEQPEDLDAETAAFAPSAVSLRAQQASPKLRFTSNAAPDLDMFMSLNGGSGTYLALGRALAAADGRFFQPGTFLAPYDDIAGQQSGAGARYRLKEDTELAV